MNKHTKLIIRIISSVDSDGITIYRDDHNIKKHNIYEN